MARPNPDELVVVTVPPFETMLPFIARQRGRELTPGEVEAERKRAPSIVLTKEAAQQMAAARAKRL
jgi:Na+-transporting NADH:ubiquinone oxidoreductase subunit NqrA